MRVALAVNRSDRYQSGFSGPDDEYEEFDSPETAAAIANTIESFGHTVDVLEADATFPETLARGKYDFVFNIAEGLRGRCRESQVPAVSEMLGIAYSGSDAVTLGVTLDKELAKRVVGGRVPTAGGKLFKTARSIDLRGLKFPLLIKPNAEGSSKGITNASRITEAEGAKERIAALIDAYNGPVLAEEFLPGLECTVGVVGNEMPRVVGAMEISPRNVPLEEFVYSLETKRDYLNQVDYHIPPRVSPETLKQIYKVAIEAYKALECRDFARVDVRLDSAGKPRFIECNPLPGLSPVKGDLVILAKASGMTYRELIGEILDASMSRQGLLIQQRAELKCAS
ncbi:MAG TPA: D-alanine--D-alanine ligase [Candidatus Ozemobacteraceae bacterium]|nr:D-alanine--D-alanine ligase [Candidatus Ozemobacteraceae bacterium]